MTRTCDNCALRNTGYCGALEFKSICIKWTGKDGEG